MRRLIHRLRRASGLAVPAGLDDEARWLSAVAAGDADAFAQVLHEHGPLVFAACQRVLRNHSDADDAFQAAFLVFLRRVRTLRPPLAPWLYSVAVRTALAMRASAARQNRLHERYAHKVRAEPETSGGTPDTELRADIDRELMHLPERERVAITLCDLEGCSRPRRPRGSVGCPGRSTAAWPGAASGSRGGWPDRGTPRPFCSRRVRRSLGPRFRPRCWLRPGTWRRVTPRPKPS